MLIEKLAQTLSLESFVFIAWEDDGDPQSLTSCLIECFGFWGVKERWDSCDENEVGAISSSLCGSKKFKNMCLLIVIKNKELQTPSEI